MGEIEKAEQDVVNLILETQVQSDIAEIDAIFLEIVSFFQGLDPGNIDSETTRQDYQAVAAQAFDKIPGAVSNLNSFALPTIESTQTALVTSSAYTKYFFVLGGLANRISNAYNKAQAAIEFAEPAGYLLSAVSNLIKANQSSLAEWSSYNITFGGESNLAISLIGADVGGLVSIGPVFSETTKNYINIKLFPSTGDVSFETSTNDHVLLIATKLEGFTISQPRIGLIVKGSYGVSTSPPKEFALGAYDEPVVPWATQPYYTIPLPPDSSLEASNNSWVFEFILTPESTKGLDRIGKYNLNLVAIKNTVFDKYIVPGDQAYPIYLTDFEEGDPQLLWGI